MTRHFEEIFLKYPEDQAPFLHHQYRDWEKSKPLKGLRVLNHVPFVQNSLLKIACLMTAGAEVIATNPNFLSPCPTALEIMRRGGGCFVDDLNSLRGEKFDLYFDCGAALYTALGPPRIGAIELTGTGDLVYQNMKLACPVMSIDKSLTKQLETVFGMAISSARAIEQLSKTSIEGKRFLVFGFGKIGRGLAYFCKKNNTSITIADPNALSRDAAHKLEIDTVDTNNIAMVKKAVEKSDIVITSTGGFDVLKKFSKDWFIGKVLANMGILDEFGPRFHESEVLNSKKAINFVLEEPTPTTYIDPELYAHNQAALDFLDVKFENGLYTMRNEMDLNIIRRWCDYHSQSVNEIEKWFIPFNQLSSLTDEQV